MSKLTELLDELSPDGVEYRPLGELCSKTSRFKWENLLENAQYVDLTSVDIPTRRISATTEVDESTAPSRARQEIRVGDVLFGTTRPTQMRICIVPEAYDKQVASTGYCVLRAEQDVVLPSWLFYALQTGGFATFLENNQSTGSYPAISDKKLKQYQIPVPPLEVQQEIVRVLDAFTDLEQSLVSELALRKKQFSYIRSTLVSSKNREMTTLGGISRNLDSRRVPITQRDRVTGEIPYYGASGIVDYVSDYIFDGDYLLVSEDGANLKTRVSPIAFSVSGKSWVNNHAHVLEFDSYAARRFAEHYINDSDIGAFVSGGAQPKFNQKNLSVFPIPVYSDWEKESLVSKLDAFEALIQSIEREIVLRRRQYEFYRDELLSFTSKEV